MALSLSEFIDSVLCNDLSTTKGNIFLGYIETDPEPFLVEESRRTLVTSVVS